MASRPELGVRLFVWGVLFTEKAFPSLGVPTESCDPSEREGWSLEPRTSRDNKESSTLGGIPSFSFAGMYHSKTGEVSFGDD